MDKTVKMILAKSRNGVIGYRGKIPWKHPEDLKRFKSLTVDCSVVMGRKTWESLPASIRPLVNRENIIISRNPDYSPEHTIVVDSVEKAIEAATKPTVWIIGGSEIYTLALPYVSEVEVTLVHEFHHGDTFAPVLNGFRTSRQEDIYKTFGNERLPVLTYVTLVNSEAPIKPEIVTEAVTSLPDVQDIWLTMRTARRDGRWLNLRGKYPNTEDEVVVIGRYGDGRYPEGWEDKRGKEFWADAWRYLNT
jgi:dihydrofolate reductase